MEHKPADSTSGYVYQYGFSSAHAAHLYDPQMRGRKARKMLAVLDDYHGGRLDGLTALDVGCSTGIVASVLGTRLAKVVGVDIDEEAVRYARETFTSDRVEFRPGDAMNLAFPDNSFDVTICAQVYEHVPDSRRLMAEMRRVLKPGGVCYFAAGNRLLLIEGHYRLPLLSVLPKPLGHLYLRVLGKGRYYYENHLTLWGLRRLVAAFEVIDYTQRILADPVRYCATDMLRPGSFKQRAAVWVARWAYWLCPTYIWLLRKGDGGACAFGENQ